MTSDQILWRRLVPALIATLVASGWCLAVLLAHGCSPAAPTPAQHADAVSLSEEMLDCVDEAGTRAEADACRAAVRARHGRPAR